MRKWVEVGFIPHSTVPITWFPIQYQYAHSEAMDDKESPICYSDHLPIPISFGSVGLQTV